MLVGYNHNFRYKGVLYHVQTEDGGVKNPHIVTHLFHGGTILVSRKVSYSDILSADNLEKVVQDLMKSQHQSMLRRLKNGEFDDKIRIRLGEASPAEEADAPPAPLQPPSPPPQVAKKPPTKEANLEDIVLSYFIGDQEPHS